ncbi:uncharacterized protein G2W53_044906 [Senna tora]|uniref:Uncharacterized protein n=1 Tax=Senna tora TaxID=362788 RepID=A0A834SBR1_9FABA|nr:uncharacterized protein G2W53_044906 [Senna tora]
MWLALPLSPFRRLVVRGPYACRLLTKATPSICVGPVG